MLDNCKVRCYSLFSLLAAQPPSLHARLDKRSEQPGTPRHVLPYGVGGTFPDPLHVFRDHVRCLWHYCR